MLQAYKFSGVPPAASSKSFPIISKSGVRFTPKAVTPIVGDPASLGLGKSLLVNPRPLTRRTINEIRWPPAVPTATASPPPSQPAPLVAAPETTANTKVKDSIDKSSNDLPRIPPEFIYTNSGLLIKLGHSTTSAELAKMLSSAGVPSSAAPRWADKILTLAHSHGFNAVLYALTGSELVMAGVKWFWPGTAPARLYAVGALALVILLPLAYFFTHESSPFAGKWLLDATESQYSSGDVPSAATVTVTEESSDLKVTEDRVLGDHKATHLIYTLHLDGRYRPTPKGLAGDSMAASATGNTLTITYKEGSRELAREKRVVSADQKQMAVSFLRHTTKGDVEDSSVYDKK